MKNTPTGKGIRTAYQTIIGTVVAYFTGLLAIPEVREYTLNFVRSEGVATLVVVLVAFGVGAGVTSYLQNRLGR